MKKIILILLITLCSCNNDCSEQKTNIFNKYQDLINKASANPAQQDRLRDERDSKLASIDC